MNRLKFKISQASSIGSRLSVNIRPRKWYVAWLWVKVFAMALINTVKGKDSSVCNCKNIEIGSYDNQVELKAPKWSSRKTICVDACLKDEILYLWNIGIRTTGCCCGHNKIDGFIGVFDEDIPKMKALGYKVQYNSCRPNDEDSFKPKSIK